jgi:phytoene/squalene synthetase
VVDAEVVARSDLVCSALQLANFWQDVARDADIGRVYLPQEDLRRFDVDERDLFERRYSDRFAELISFEVERTERMFAVGASLIGSLRGRARLMIALFVAGGLTLLDKIKRGSRPGRSPFDVLGERPKISGIDAPTVLARAIKLTTFPPRPIPLDQTAKR